MANVAQITIEVDEKGAVTSLNNISNAVKKIDPALEQVGRRGNVVMTGLARDHQKAHDAAALFGRTMGVELPRQLEKFLASSAAVGPALGAAFNVAVFAGFAGVILDLLGKIPALTDKIFDFTGALKEGEEAQKKLNAQLIEGAQRLRELQDQYNLIGLTGSRQFAQGQQNIRDEIERTEKRVKDTKKVIDDLGKVQSLGRFEGFARIGNLLTGGDTPLEKATKEMTAAQDEIMKLGNKLQVLQQESKNTGREFSVAFSQEQTDHIIAMNMAFDQMRENVIKLALGPTLDAAAKSAKDAELAVNAMNIAMDAAKKHQQETAQRRIEISKDVLRAEEDAAIASLPPWQRANAQIVLDFERRKREIDEVFKGIENSGGLKARALAAAWQEAFARTRDELANQMEGLFDDITSGNIGKRFLQEFKHMVFQMLATWILGMNQMRSASQQQMGSGGGILGTIFGSLGLGGIFGSGSASGGPGGTPQWNPGAGYSVGPGGAAGYASLPLGGSAGGGFGGAGSTLPSGAGKGGLADLLAKIFPKGSKGLSIGGMNISQQMLATGGIALLLANWRGGGILHGLGGALGGAMLGTAIFPGIGTIIGAIAGFISGIFGKSTKKARLAIEHQIEQQAKTIEDAYNLFQMDWLTSRDQLEQLRTQGVEALRKAGVKDISRSRTGHVDYPIDLVEKRIDATQAERNKREAMVFGPPQFRRGGYVGPGLGSPMPSWFAGTAMHFAGGGA